jgi:serine O-acetyltransferase
MIISLDKTDLTSYVVRQLNSYFPDKSVTVQGLSSYVKHALERVEYCFSHINIKYFFDGQQTHFNHLHTDQYAMYLYFLSNTIYRLEGEPAIASKVYALNKALHAIDVFFEVELPDIFAFQHPVGTVLGRGKYSNYFYVYQRCSIGSNLKGEYPTLGEGVVMFGGSGVIGNSVVGENCWLSVGSLVMNMDVPANSIVFGCSPENSIKATQRNVVRDLFLNK